MFKIIPLLSTITSLVITIQPVKAFTTTLQSSTNLIEYDDVNGIGLNSWLVDDSELLNEAGWFYRIGDNGTAQSIGTLTEDSSNNNGNSASVNYSDSDFSLDLSLLLTDGGSTLNQVVIVTNTTASPLNFYLYSYLDLTTSIGVGGDTVAIDGSTYTATQSGDSSTITTTIVESIATIIGGSTVGSNTTLTARRAEVDAIDFNEDTLLDKLQSPGDTPLLDNDLAPLFSDSDPVTIAYEWNYNLAADESFQIGVNSNATAVPFEFSPSLGMLLVGIFWSIVYLKRTLNIH